MWRRDHGKENKATPANAAAPAPQAPTTTAAAAAASRPAGHHAPVSSGGSTSIKPVVSFPAASQPAPAPAVAAPSRKESATTVAQAASVAPVLKKSSTAEREKESEREHKKDREDPTSPKEKDKDEKERKKKHREKGDKDKEKERDKESKRDSKAIKLNKEQVVSQMIGASDLGDFKPWYYDESEKPGDFSDGTLRAMRFIAAGYFILAWQNGKVPVGWKRPRKLDDFVEIYGEELVAQAKAKVARSQSELAEREKQRLAKFLKGEVTDPASDSKKTQVETEAAEELHTLVERNFVETSIVMPLGRGGTASAFEMRSSFSEDFVEALRKKEEATKKTSMMKEKEKMAENAAVMQEVASMALDGSVGMPALSGSNASSAAATSNQPIDLTNPANTQGKSKAWIMAMERKQKIEAEKQQKLEQEKTEQKQAQEKKEAMDEKERRLQEIQRERLENMDETHVKAPWMLNKKPSMPNNAADNKEESSSEEDEEEEEEEGEQEKKKEGNEEAKVSSGEQGEDGGSLVLVGRSKSGREVYGTVTDGQYDDADHDKQGLVAAAAKSAETKTDENARDSDDDLTIKHGDRSVVKTTSEEPAAPVAMWRTALSKKKLEDLSAQTADKDKETSKEESAVPAWRSVLKSSKAIPDAAAPAVVTSPAADNIQKSDSNSAPVASTWGVKLSSKALDVESEKKEEVKQDQLESVPSWARQRKPSTDGSAPVAAIVEEKKKDEPKQEPVQSVPSWARQRKPSMDESAMPAVSVSASAKKADEEESVPPAAGWRNVLKSSKSVAQNDEAATAASAVVQTENEIKKDDDAVAAAAVPAWKAQLKPAADPKVETASTDTLHPSESKDSAASSSASASASAIPAWRSQLKSSEAKTAEASSTKDAQTESKDSGSGLPAWRTQLKSSTETPAVKAEETVQAPSWAKKSTESEKTSVTVAAVSSVHNDQNEAMRKELKEMQDEKASIRQEMDKHMQEMQKLQERFEQLEVRLGKLEKSSGNKS